MLLWVGELIAFHDISDLVDIDLEAREELEYTYLPQYLEAAKLQRFNQVLQDNDIKNEINRLIQQVKT